ncbi:Asp-tRNA(Asn)/Glu-tRNA(Gln) amidotransferase subunit GatC [Collinsella provencensis]|uniref:Asp-tRNA(Asn)/Glu-tRNA(Gln) amidotransferase subunit GatC n=1 Tax=Collinsella provencensis TaxID=1937461 RepID=UPI000C826F97|nr:Asp-tRNA(Asn)/Glu-tRNA(Gln) amidotransferase subunit GatC [Collinsella provencensis]
MALTQDDVHAIADYACIALEGEELEQMTSYLNDAVEMVEPILNYTAEDVEPTFHPIGTLSNVMRDDAVDTVRALPIDAALSNAAASRERQFRVPSILGGGEQ